MRSGLKFAVSLLISVILFAGFIVISYSGLFDYIETTFYHSRVKDFKQQESEVLKTNIEKYHSLKIESFSVINENSSIARNYLPNISEEDIFSTSNLVSVLKKENPGLLFMRLIDQNRNIHYSSLSQDLKEDSRYKKIYNNFDEESEGILLTDIFKRVSEGPFVMANPEKALFEYFFPVYDNINTLKGAAAFYVAEKDLYQYLIKVNAVELGRDFNVLVNGYLSGLNIAGKNDIRAEIEDKFKNENDAFVIIPVTDESTELFIFSSRLENGGYSGLAVDSVDFILTRNLKFLLVAAFGITIFLIVFLIFNINQDSDIVINDRIKKLQMSFLQQFVDRKEEIDWTGVQTNIIEKKEIINRQIKKGLGRKASKKDADEIIEKNWEEIISLISEKSIQQPVARPQLENIEEIIKEALSKSNIVISGDNVKLSASVSAAGAGQSPTSVNVSGTTNAVEQIEDTEELDFGEEILPLDLVESDDKSEPVEIEEIKDAEEIEDAELVSDLETEELAELADVESAEEPEDLEELEELAELDETDEELSEVVEIADSESLSVEDSEDTEPVSDLETEELEDLADVEVAEEPEDLLELEELEELEELAELDETDEELSEVVEIADSESLSVEDSEDTEPVSDLETEELEDLADVEVAEAPAALEAIQPEYIGTDSEQSLVFNSPDSIFVEELDNKTELALENDKELSGESLQEKLQVLYPDMNLLKTEPLDLEILFQEENIEGDIGVFDDEELEAENDYDDLADELEPEDLEELSELDDLEELDEEFAELETASTETESIEVSNVDDAELEELEELDELEEVEETDSQDYVHEDFVSEELETLDAEDINEEEFEKELSEVEEQLEELPAFETADEEVSNIIEIEHTVSGSRTDNFYTSYNYNIDFRALKGESSRVIADRVPEHMQPAASIAIKESDTVTVKEEVSISPAERDFLKDLESVIKKNLIEVESAESVYLKTGGPSDNSIQEEDGVFRINEKTIANSVAKDNTFKELVDSIISVEEDAEEESLSIFKDREVDLFDLGLPAEAPEKEIEQSSDSQLFNPDGFDYDFYLNNFSANITGISKSLLRITQKMDALCAAVFTSQGNKIKVEYSVGMDAKSRTLMFFKDTEPFYLQIIKRKQYVFIKKSTTGIDAIDSRIKKEDRVHFSGYLYIPVKFRDTEAYLFVGLKKDKGSMEEYIKILKEQLA